MAPERPTFTGTKGTLNKENEAAVKAVQTFLQDKGYLTKEAIDGKWNEADITAVKKFQTDYQAAEKAASVAEKERMSIDGSVGKQSELAKENKPR